MRTSMSLLLLSLVSMAFVGTIIPGARAGRVAQLMHRVAKDSGAAARPGLAHTEGKSISDRYAVGDSQGMTLLDALRQYQPADATPEPLQLFQGDAKRIWEKLRPQVVDPELSNMHLEAGEARHFREQAVKRVLENADLLLLQPTDAKLAREVAMKAVLAQTLQEAGISLTVDQLVARVGSSEVQAMLDDALLAGSSPQAENTAQLDPTFEDFQAMGEEQARAEAALEDDDVAAEDPQDVFYEEQATLLIPIATLARTGAATVAEAFARLAGAVHVGAGAKVAESASARRMGAREEVDPMEAEAMTSAAEASDAFDPAQPQAQPQGQPQVQDTSFIVLDLASGEAQQALSSAGLLRPTGFVSALPADVSSETETSLAPLTVEELAAAMAMEETEETEMESEQITEVSANSFRAGEVSAAWFNGKGQAKKRMDSVSKGAWLSTMVQDVATAAARAWQPIQAAVESGEEVAASGAVTQQQQDYGDESLSQVSGSAHGEQPWPAGKVGVLLAAQLEQPL